MHDQPTSSEVVEMLAAELRSNPNTSQKTLKLLEQLEAGNSTQLRLEALRRFTRSIWTWVGTVAFPIWASFMVQLFFHIPILNQWEFMFTVAILALAVSWMCAWTRFSLLKYLPKLFHQVTDSFAEDVDPRPRHGLRLLPPQHTFNHTFSGPSEPPTSC